MKSFFNDVSVLMWSWNCMMFVFLTLPSLQPQIDSWTRSVFLLGPSKCISGWAETALRSSIWITIKRDPQVAVVVAPGKPGEEKRKSLPSYPWNSTQKPGLLLKDKLVKCRLFTVGTVCGSGSVALPSLWCRAVTSSWRSLKPKPQMTRVGSFVNALPVWISSAVVP